MNRLLLCCVTAALGGAAAPIPTALAVDVLFGSDVIAVETGLPATDDLWVTADDFTRINGFEIKPEGACYRDLCVPIQQDSDNDLYVKRDGQRWFNATKFADKVQQAYVVDRDQGVWSFAMVPSSRQPFLESAIAPDFELQDRTGNSVRLSDFRGKKVLIITWASW
jgi:hypothetical protein